ncbi:hypothetical protein EG359_08105 [Chryseobacterium joostei]|uniref:Uncharacterized protein n=1 Tax=Chryseobacterium joostei TaxID=112234 RepID=A0A1N7I281_9FLAO|nr:hypothetical protein [Chryseobacterium joostei]AZA99576.1 hypothetical protein EG359_08105 [Chryseobacterium joostei]SIS31167.1 hypothetical protein SAMN05421768_102267 [Chryseobacterium joostei]SIS48333.1 hypothetical protein SAMN05421768_108266 [Chryseobacterium joostei]
MLEIEFEEPNVGICDCCGNIITQLTRFVYLDDSAFAIYYANFTEGHEGKNVLGLISLGEWGTGDIPDCRTSFLFRLGIENDEYSVIILDGSESPWQNKILGKILHREEALQHPWKQDVFHITNHIVNEDKEIIKYLKN